MRYGPCVVDNMSLTRRIACDPAAADGVYDPDVVFGRRLCRRRTTMVFSGSGETGAIAEANVAHLGVDRELPTFTPQWGIRPRAGLWRYRAVHYM